MKTIIAGGRDYHLTSHDYDALAKLDISEVISGGAEGADRGGEAFALTYKLPCKRFPADWGAHGRAAGPIRNKEMAKYGDAVVLFPGGRGTESMRREAEKAGLKIYDWRSDRSYEWIPTGQVGTYRKRWVFVGEEQ